MSRYRVLVSSYGWEVSTMAPRLELQTLLEETIDSGNVYFQPPANVQLAYPAIVYQRDDLNTKFANNGPYAMKQRYQVTYIDRDPDSDVPYKIAALPMCIFSRFFVADNLNHDVFTLFF
jgi:hypothetical protein